MAAGPFLCSTQAEKEAKQATPPPSRWAQWLALPQKSENNPMHSRTATVGRQRVRAIKRLPRRTNQRQTGKERGICGANMFSQQDRQPGEIQGEREFRILRIPFDASGKTVAVCHAGSSRKSLPATCRAPAPDFSEIRWAGDPHPMFASSRSSGTVPAHSRLHLEAVGI